MMSVQRRHGGDTHQVNGDKTTDEGLSARHLHLPEKDSEGAKINGVETITSDQSSEKSDKKGAGGVTVYFNCRVLRGYELVRDEVWVCNGKVISAESVDRKADHIVDCRNAILCPGFIDLQVNGAFGVDFLTHPELPAGLQDVNRKLPATGVTLYCPTLITSPPSYFHQTLPQIAPTPGSAECGAGVLGVHCEGPFISLEKKGAHPPECIVGYGGKGFATLEKMYGSLENIRLITLAPEYEQSMEVIRELVKRGVVVSLGHSTTSLDRAIEAAGAGASMITHLFNAMPAFHHREPSLPGLLAAEEEIKAAVGSDRRIYFGIIADGIHTHEAALRLAHRLAPDSLVLVTDALAPMGLGCGDYKLGKQDITVQGNPKRATVKGTNTLCGCVATMDYCIRHMIQATRCSIPYALACATLHPAQCMNIADRKGTLEPGADADFVFLNDQLKVLKTFIAGRLAFTATP